MCNITVKTEAYILPYATSVPPFAKVLHMQKSSQVINARVSSNYKRPS
jgi:hypothetical protein